MSDHNPAWDRYVMPFDERPPIENDGSLVLDPEAACGYNPERGPQPAAMLAGDPSSFVLLGPAGSGKSAVLEALRPAELEAVGVDLRASVEHIEEALDAAIKTGGPVYVDALDTAVGDPQLLGALERWLTSPRARQVAWRFACRPAAWNACFARSLADALGGLRQLRWLSAVDRWPAPRLPGNSLAAMRLELRRWLPGQDEGRGRPAMSAERQQRIACRLGAIAVFAHARGFARGGRGDDGVVSAAELPSAPEPDEPNAPVMWAEYQSVLDSGLFDPAAQGMVAFRDRRDADFLAAAYLVERGVDRDRLHQLLGVQADGLIPPATVGVAAWVTALAPQLTTDLVAANAVALAGVGLAFPSDHVKAAIVDHLLTGASLDTVGAAQDVDLAPLAHPGLADQLEHTMEAGLSRPELLWWVARLAAAGTCHRLVEPLVAHALDPAWPSWARSPAVDAVIQLGEPAHRQRLTDLLHLSEAEDPDDELLGRTLTGVVSPPAEHRRDAPGAAPFPQRGRARRLLRLPARRCRLYPR